MNPNTGKSAEVEKRQREAQAAPQSLPAQALAQTLGTHLERGLDDDQANRVREEIGFNELTERPPPPMWLRFLGQFRDPVIWLLLIAAVVAGFVGELADSLAIVAIVLLNALLSFYQEERAEQAIAALRKLSTPLAKVVRGGELRAIPAREIVPGDRLEMEAGDRVAADARLIDSNHLRTQEASLTGESAPVVKDATLLLAADTPLADRRNMVYQGTIVAAGKGSAVVVATGMSSELGQIAGLLQEQPRETTPLQRRLAELGRVLVVVCLALVGVIFLMQLRRGGDLGTVFLVSVSLAVAAVPEGLPAVVTLALALGLQRMARRNALIRKLPSVETLGSVTAICSDKTGTLTCNEMTVRAIFVDDREVHVSGTGYQPHGEFSCRGFDEEHEPTTTAAPYSGLPTRPLPRECGDLATLLTAGARCNNARLVPNATKDDWQVIGDPTEGALLVAALKGGVAIEPDGWTQVAEIPFDSERKAMSVVVQMADGSRVMYLKGAPEVVLSRCRDEIRQSEVRGLSQERREVILRQGAELAHRALRVLGLAYRPVSNDDELFQERELVFLGLVGMIDPPRDEARQAVRMCQTAGIQVVMITGDHPSTAKAVAKELGILTPGAGVLTGQELDELSDDELASRIERTNVFARVSAQHKLRVVRAWQKARHVVAMTGDGVNDAPAVKAADIGIGMGITGTEVTKEASDMVLADDNFRSIVSAVEEGRSIFENIQNVVHYLLSTNAGEVIFMFFAAVVGWPVPLAAIQILWINLVTDALPALSLTLEPADRNMMQRPPRPPNEPVLRLKHGALILLSGTLVAAMAAVGFWNTYQGDPSRLAHARTVSFCVLAFSQLFFAFACRSQRYTLPQLGLFSNPYLLAAIVISALLQFSVVMWPAAQPILEISAQLTHEWVLILALALVPVSVLEIGKLIAAALGRQRPGQGSEH